MGIFIQIDIESKQLSPDLSKKLVSICPVDIFKLEGDRLVARPEQVDECTLCDLCLDIAPTGSLTILKKYSNQKLLSRGA